MDRNNEDSWDPRIYGAHAVSGERFCLFLSELEYDDPFTAIIEYNRSYQQPWTRTDVRREICAVVGLENWYGDYAALSNEGNFYIFGESSAEDKIPGAGVLSPDATGAGAMFDLAQIGTTLWAVGACGQIFTKRNETAAWQNVAFNLPTIPGFQKADMGYCSGVNESDVYICGILKPDPVRLDKITEDRLISTNASQKEWDQAYELAEEKMQNFWEVNEGRLYHWNGDTLNVINLPVPDETVFRCVFCESSDRIWIGGTGGVLLRGNAKDGFLLAANFNETQRLASIAKYQDEHIIATQNNLYRFDGTNARLLNPPFANEPLRPRKVQAVQKSLFYFDYRAGVFKFDGKNWDQIKIPKGLYRRAFVGLL